MIKTSITHILLWFLRVPQNSLSIFRCLAFRCRIRASVRVGRMARNHRMFKTAANKLGQKSHIVVAVDVVWFMRRDVCGRCAPVVGNGVGAAGGLEGADFATTTSVEIGNTTTTNNRAIGASNYNQLSSNVSTQQLFVALTTRSCSPCSLSTTTSSLCGPWDQWCVAISRFLGLALNLRQIVH